MSFRIRRSIALVVLCISIISFIQSPLFAAVKLAFHYYDPFSIAEFRLRRLPTAVLVSEIEQTAEQGDISQARSLIEVAKKYGHQIPDEVVAKTKESMSGMVWRNSHGFLNGVVSGEVDTPASIAGSLAADYFVIGDLRDVVTEGTKYSRGEDYDKLTLCLATFGLMTIPPGSGPLDSGASLIKTASKAKKLSSGMISMLRTANSELIDMRALRRGLSQTSIPSLRMPNLTVMKESLQSITIDDINRRDFSKLKRMAAEMMPVDVASIRRNFDGVLVKRGVDEVKLFTTSTGSIVANGGVTGALKALEHADNAKELERFAKLAERTSDETSSVIRLLGKKAIYLADLIYQVVAGLLFLSAWIATAVWVVFRSFFSLRLIFAS